MEFKSPHGPVDVPALGLVDVTVVEATGDDAKSLEAQGWTRVDKPKKKTAKPGRFVGESGPEMYDAPAGTTIPKEPKS